MGFAYSYPLDHHGIVHGGWPETSSHDSQDKYNIDLDIYMYILCLWWTLFEVDPLRIPFFAVLLVVGDVLRIFH